MQPSKNLAIAFLLGAVTVGGALGFAADRVMMRERLSPPVSSRERIAKRLELDDGQRARLDSILDDRHRRYSTIMAAVNPTLDSIRMRARDDIRLMLSEAQRAEFEAMLAESNQTRNDPNQKRHDD